MYVQVYRANVVESSNATAIGVYIALLLFNALPPPPVNDSKRTCSEYPSKKDVRACICPNKELLSRFSSQKTTHQQKQLFRIIYKTGFSHAPAQPTTYTGHIHVHYFPGLVHGTNVGGGERIRLSPAIARGRTRHRTPAKYPFAKLHTTNLAYCPRE